MSDNNFVFDPKNPEAYFMAFSALQDLSLGLQKELLKDDNSAESNNQTFFEIIKKKQEDIMNVQKELHNDAKNTEHRLTNAAELISTHKQFDNTVSFFEEKENKMGLMSEMMEDLTKTVSELPD